MLPKAAMRQLARKTIQMLNESERPVILVGNGVRVAGGEKLFEEVVDALGVPVLTTRLGVDLLHAAHPLCFGMPGGIASRAANFTLQNSDFLLTIGTRLDMQMMAYAPERFARAAKKVMVNIDEPEIRKLGKLIDLAVPADAKAFLSALLELRGNVKPRDRGPWMERCRNWRVSLPFRATRTETATRRHQHVRVSRGAGRPVPAKETSCFRAARDSQPRFF